jgi:hypothetical protein
MRERCTKKTRLNTEGYTSLDIPGQDTKGILQALRVEVRTAFMWLRAGSSSELM